jgi:hypothetical protein
LAEDPALFRVIWSAQTLIEVERTLRDRFQYTAEQVGRRIRVLTPHYVLAQSADDFLIHQYHLNPGIVLEKLDMQASAIRRQREDVVNRLERTAPKFAALIRAR